MTKLLELSDQEIIDIANPLWEDLIRTSNNKDYGGLPRISQKKCSWVLTRLHSANNGLTARY